jgi:hypothetical protein
VGERWFLVGSGDREFTEPRLNQGWLQRVARASGGSYYAAGEAQQAIAALRSAAPRVADPEPRDLWHAPWAILTIILLLGAEWMLRRWWGLR